MILPPVDVVSLPLETFKTFEDAKNPGKGFL